MSLSMSFYIQIIAAVIYAAGIFNVCCGKKAWIAVGLHFTKTYLYILYIFGQSFVQMPGHFKSGPQEWVCVIKACRGEVKAAESLLLACTDWIIKKRERRRTPGVFVCSFSFWWSIWIICLIELELLLQRRIPCRAIQSTHLNVHICILSKTIP